MMRGVSLIVASMSLVAVLALAACSLDAGQPGQSDTIGGQGGMMGGQSDTIGGQDGMMGSQGGMMGGQSDTIGGQDGMMGGQGGMMGGQGGMMGSQGGMMGGQGGMMGGWGGYNPNAQQVTIDDAVDAVEDYVRTYYGQDLALAEVMEFAWNFYAEVEEEESGIHAMELLIDRYTGQVYPEMGPSTMWNTKYGAMSQMMGSYYGGEVPTVEMPVTPEQAKSLAQHFLDTNLPGLDVAHADTFYGYYTLHTLKNGQIEGMMSVNGNTGAVWYHSWHGPFIGIWESHEENEVGY